jgi:hypothetical protein
MGKSPSGGPPPAEGGFPQEERRNVNNERKRKVNFIANDTVKGVKPLQNRSLNTKYHSKISKIFHFYT